MFFLYSKFLVLILSHRNNQKKNLCLGWAQDFHIHLNKSETKLEPCKEL
jgi:hypothetical protein